MVFELKVVNQHGGAESTYTIEADSSRQAVEFANEQGQYVLDIKPAKGQPQVHLPSATLPRINPAMICPHCQTKGTVSTRHVERNIGISDDKASAAFWTGGLTIPFRGLAEKETITEAHCSNCNNTWRF